MLTKRSSIVLNNMKCILSVFVVMIHTQIMSSSWASLGGADYKEYLIFQKVFSDVFLDHSCVPVFFLISGYLFFLKIRDDFSVDNYKNQLSKRIKGLAIPFCIANLAYYIVLRILPSLKCGAIGVDMVDDFFTSFWSYHDTNIPINGPLWYIRDLLVLSFLSPIIYYVIKSFKYYALIALCGLWLLGFWFDNPGFTCYPILFFSIGSYFAIQGKDIVSVFKSKAYIALCIIYPFIVFLVSFIGYRNGDECAEYLLSLKVAQLVSVSFWFVIIIGLSKYFIIPKMWVTATFFVFLYHYALAVPSRIIGICNMPFTNGTLFMLYIGGVFLEVVLLMVIYTLLKKFFPRLSSIIVGGR